MKTIPKRYPKIVVGTFALALVILIMSFIAYDKSTTEANNTVLEITSVSIIDGNYKIDTNIAINNGIKEKNNEIKRYEIEFPSYKAQFAED